MRTSILVIIALFSLVALAWFWPRNTGLRHTTARTWPAGRGKAGLRHKL